MPHEAIKTQAAIDYLTAHPELHDIGAKRLFNVVTDLKVSRRTWQRARIALNLPELPRGGQYRAGKWDTLKKPFMLYPDTHAIEINTVNKCIKFYSVSGVRTVTKRSQLAIKASMRLFESGGWKFKEHFGNGVIVLRKK